MKMKDGIKMQDKNRMIDGHRDRMINRFLYGRNYILAFYHIYYVTLLHNCTKIILCVKGACHEIFYHIFLYANQSGYLSNKQ